MLSCCHGIAVDLQCWNYYRRSASVSAGFVGLVVGLVAPDEIYNAMEAELILVTVMIVVG